MTSAGKVFFVPGNADAPGSEVPEGVIQLHGSTSAIGRCTIGGLGGSNATPSKTPFELPDGEAREILSAAGRVDILVSHCPPLNTRCDRVGSAHIGSLPVREYVVREHPALVLSGHAHDSRAIDRLGDSTLVNPGPLMNGDYAEVDLSGVISVELKSGSL